MERKHNQLYCRSCNTYQHRSSFLVPIAHVYDTYCVKCRPKTLKLKKALLLKRVDKGVTPRAKYNAEMARRHAEKQKRGEKIGTRVRKPDDSASWEYAIKSAKTALYVLRKYKKPGEAYERWHVQANTFVRVSLAAIKNSQQTQVITVEYPLWYDVLSGTRTKLKALIDAYPDGAAASPLQTF